MKQKVWLLLSILLIGLWLGSGLFHAGWFVSHDGIFHVRRAAEMVEQLKSGAFPVRYAPSLDNNYGVPLFNYAYPGPYYVVGIAHLLSGIGIPSLIKALMLSSLLGSALAWYLYFRTKPLVAWTTSLISLFTPYLLSNMYVRGALGEMFTLSLLPWALVAQAHVLKSGNLRWYSPLPLFLAFISHNYIGYLALPLLALHVLSVPNRWRLGLINLGLALGLASFFWLPMYFERGLLLSGASNIFSFPYTDHFVAWWQLFFSRWGYGFSYPGTERDGMTFALGSVPLVALISVLCVSWYQRRSIARQLMLPVAIIAATLFLMTQPSQFLWDLIPPLAAVQFPWRLLGIVALLIPYTAGVAFSSLKSEKGVTIIGIALALIGLIATFNQRSFVQILSRDEFNEVYAAWQNGTTTSYREEIAPRWASIEHASMSPEYGSKFVFQKEVTIATKTTFPKNYFPSWQGTIDGKPLTLSPSENGEISFTLEPGLHEYQLFVGSTDLEKWANIATLFSLVLLLYVVRYTK